MRKRQIAFLIAFALFVAWVSVWIVAMVWPKEIVTEGAVGPFVIGQTKAEVREFLETHGKWPPEADVAERKYLERLDLFALENTFRDDDGIIVHFCCRASNTRLDFEGNRLVRIWPDLILDNPHADIRAAEEDMERFRDELHIGMSKSDALLAISEIDAERKITVANYLVGDDHFRQIRRGYKLPEYSEFAFQADGWQFYGFKDLAWYSWLFTPFSARLNLSFKNDRLYRIEYYSTPSELP